MPVDDGPERAGEAIQAAHILSGYSVLARAESLHQYFPSPSTSIEPWPGEGADEVHHAALALDSELQVAMKQLDESCDSVESEGHHPEVGKLHGEYQLLNQLLTSLLIAAQNGRLSRWRGEDFGSSDHSNGGALAILVFNLAVYLKNAATNEGVVDEVSRLAREQLSCLKPNTSAESFKRVPTPKKPKRSTARGEGRDKCIAVLTKHHEYADGGCLNMEPIGNNELARLAEVSPSTATAFFNNEFNGRNRRGYAKYRVICRDAGRLTDSLKALRGEFSPHELYGRRPPGEDDREHDE